MIWYQYTSFILFVTLNLGVFEKKLEKFILCHVVLEVTPHHLWYYMPITVNLIHVVLEVTPHYLWYYIPITVNLIVDSFCNQAYLLLNNRHYMHLYLPHWKIGTIVVVLLQIVFITGYLGFVSGKYLVSLTLFVEGYEEK